MPAWEAEATGLLASGLNHARPTMALLFAQLRNGWLSHVPKGQVSAKVTLCSPRTLGEAHGVSLVPHFPTGEPPWTIRGQGQVRTASALPWCCSEVMCPLALAGRHGSGQEAKVKDRVWGVGVGHRDLVHAEEGCGFRGPASTPGEGQMQEWGALRHRWPWEITNSSQSFVFPKSIFHS